MQFQPTPIAGVLEVSIDWYRDERGRFGRTFCLDEFAGHGLVKLVQCNTATNPRRGTVRGFHMQAKPHEEAKLVQCVAGRMLDVALDLRPNSPTYGKHHAVELSAESGRMLFVPENCGHAYQTLEDETSLVYYVSAAYARDSERGVFWNDPAIGVNWPIKDVIVSERDQQLPRLADFRPLP